MTYNPNSPTSTRRLDTHVLARIGFTLIRSLIQGRRPGGLAAALDLADALHNLPEPGNEFLVELTLKSLDEFVSNYPEFKSSLSAAVDF
ncbi:MAG: hypothetical protein BACC_04488 [Bacteroides sp.]